MMDDDVRRALTAQQPLARLGLPRDIADGAFSARY